MLHVIICMSDYYYEIPLFFLFCCFSDRFSLKRLRLILLFGADCTARKCFLAQVGSAPVFSVTGWKHAPGICVF